MITSEIETADSETVYFLDFERHIKNMMIDTFTINNIAKDITFVPLETTSESLLAITNFKIEKSNDNYYISWARGHDVNNIMEFFPNGKFNTNIIRRGQGPNELPYAPNWTVNNNLRLLIAFHFHVGIIYSFDNKTGVKFYLKDRYDSFYPCLLNDGTIVDLPGFYSNEEYEDVNHPYMNFRNQEGEIIRSFYYPQKRDIVQKIWEGVNSPPIISSYNLYPGYTGNALFQDVFNDTIYNIRNMDEINPYIIINSGIFTVSIQDRNNKSARNQRVYIYGIIDTKKYFFVKFVYRQEVYTAIWDKKTMSFIATTKADDSKEHKYVTGNLYSYGFTKYLTPANKEILIALSCYADGKLYSMIDAEQAMEFLPNIKEDDNPVLMIIDIQ